MPCRPLVCRRGSWRSLALGACAAVVLFFAGGAGRPPALAFRRKKGIFNMLLAGNLPVKIVGGSIAIEASAEDLQGFPNSTSNTAGLQLLRHRSSPGEGAVSLRLVDPGNIDGDAGRVMEVDYQRHIPGIGDVRGHTASSGAWEAALTRDFPDVGRLKGVYDSRSHWSLGLQNSFPAVKGLQPAALVGATQDGAFFEGNVSGQFDRHSKFKYSARNPAGKYGLEDLIHEGDINLHSRRGQHELILHGIYGQNLPGDGKMRGSLQYTYRLKRRRKQEGTISASADYDTFRLQANSGIFGAAASLARNAEEESTSRRKELELRAGPLRATAKEVRGNPRFRVGLTI